MLTVLTVYGLEIACSSAFLIGFSAYAYFKLKKVSPTKHKIIYYNVSDRVIKSKKIQKRVTDQVGGVGKNDTFFKAS